MGSTWGIKKQKQLQHKMKFTLAIAALVASTNAVGSWWIAAPTNSLVGLAVETEMPLDEMFKEMDTNGNGALSLKEVTTAIESFAKAHDHKLPDGRKKSRPSSRKLIPTNQVKSPPMRSKPPSSTPLIKTMMENGALRRSSKLLLALPRSTVSSLELDGKRMSRPSSRWLIPTVTTKSVNQSSKPPSRNTVTQTSPTSSHDQGMFLKT